MAVDFEALGHVAYACEVHGQIPRAVNIRRAVAEIEALRKELAELRAHSPHLADELATATEMLENGAIAAREERLMHYRCALIVNGDYSMATCEEMAHAMLAAERPVK